MFILVSSVVRSNKKYDTCSITMVTTVGVESPWQEQLCFRSRFVASVPQRIMFLVPKRQLEFVPTHTERSCFQRLREGFIHETAWQVFRQHIYTGYTQKNGAVSEVNKKLIFHLTRAQRTPSAAATVQVSHALPAVRFSCLLRGRGASFQDGIAAEEGVLCAPFWGVQICHPIYRI
jgi:hypothetical protein